MYFSNKKWNFIPHIMKNNVHPENDLSNQKHDKNSRFLKIFPV